MATEVNGLFICPYNPSHHLEWSRLPNHLVRCRKNHPHLMNSITICPYNQCHHVLKEELANHLRHCKEHHIFKSISVKPAAHGDQLSTSLSGRVQEEQDLHEYNSHRNQFVQQASSSSSSKDTYEERQRQKNQDDLDEWFVQ